jgi:hypothetical protein
VRAARTYGQHEPGDERGGCECEEDERDDGGRVDWVLRASEHSRIRSGRGRTSADGVDVEELGPVGTSPPTFLNPVGAGAGGGGGGAGSLGGGGGGEGTRRALGPVGGLRSIHPAS